ncbi:MAG: glycosyltransferase family 9 protein [Vicinamibacterales bacterium]
MSPDPLRLLIVRLSALGDIVHALPVLSALREAGVAQVDWVVDARYERVLDLVDGIGHRYVVRAAQAGGQDGRSAFADGAAGWVAAARALRRARYDVALDLQGLLKSAIVARASGARRVVGFDRAGVREKPAAWFYTDRVATDRKAHVIRKNLALLAPLGITPPAMPRLPIVVPASPAADAAAADGPYVLVNPGGGWPNKRWDAARFGELAARIGEHEGLRVLVLWGPSERDLAQQVVDASRGCATLAPETTLGDLVALASRARLIVAGDTGPLHLAAAVGAPIVGLYGPTWPQRNGPWDPADLVISRAPACGCHHKRQCQRERRCLDDISVDNVFGMVQRRLKAAAGR